MLPGQGLNLETSDPESDVLPITPPGNECIVYKKGGLFLSTIYYLGAIFAHESLRPTVLLNTSISPEESGSTQK